MKAMLEAFNKIEMRLAIIEAGEMFNDMVAICNEGKPCELKQCYKFATLCSSAVPCKTATTHRLILSRPLR